MQTQEEVNVLVPEKLAEIERDYDVTVLWAIESGSRAWGFESPDSDFDVRFIYRQKQDFYLRLNDQRDVIELPIDDTWDVSGWDLDKTLKLLYKSNPTLFEWLQSPIVYQQTDFIERLRPLANQYFSEKKCCIIT
ncbi:nucleotidyltransferase domain protein [Streptococcus oralis SK1074]|nr:nucleotidyltransferase domain protein [Streptococcus oralis SK1074]